MNGSSPKGIRPEPLSLPGIVDMSELEWQIYKDWFTWLEAKYAKKPSGFIYLQVDPKICHQRLVKRSRSDVASVPLEYLSDLHRMHDDWLIDKKGLEGVLRDIPVLIVNGNLEFEQDKTQQNTILEQVSHFINNATILPEQAIKKVQNVKSI